MKIGPPRRGFNCRVSPRSLERRPRHGEGAQRSRPRPSRDSSSGSAHHWRRVPPRATNRFVGAASLGVSDV
ncbi:MAG: hypothetical protein OJF55_001302 [Rhodanobacteraceae bacterium]|nr:MAG: hypothetical protein OJF55_001302 [Rhodanobacteraceae bacterium]